MGWPISTEDHKGFKGNLDAKMNDRAPYYSDIYCEVIFNCPQLCRDAVEIISNLAHGNSEELSIEDGPGVTDRLFSRHKRSYSEGSIPSKTQFFQKAMEFDNVAIVWVQDTLNLTSLIENLPRNWQVLILVCPLPTTLATYYIKIVTFGNLLEDHLSLGPLQDGMILNQKHLGFLVRSTAIKASKLAQTVRNLYKRPLLARRQRIEEICSKHQGEHNEIIANLFAQ